MGSKPATDEVPSLGPNGEPVVTEETKKTIRRKATPQEIGSNGNGTGAASEDGPVNPLIGHAGGKRNADPDRIVAVKLYKGTSAKSGTHVTTIDGDEIERVDEDYIRGNFAAEWGFGPWYVQGINRKGQSVSEGGQMVNIGAPKGSGTPTPTDNGKDRVSEILMLQLAEERARAAKQQDLMQALLLQVAKPTDNGMGPILAAMVTMIGNMNGKKETDPALLQMLTDSQTRARESEAAMRELLTKLATNPPASADSKLLDSASKVMDLAVQAAGIGQGGTDPTVEKFKIVKDGIKDAVSEIAPLVAGAFRPKAATPPASPATPKPAGAPERPKRKLLVTSYGPKSAPPAPSQPTPTADAPKAAEPANGNGNGLAPGEDRRPPAVQDTEAQLETTQANPQTEVDPEVDAFRQIDQALRDEKITAQEIADFVFQAGETGVIPGWQIGGLVELTPEGLKPWPRRLALMKGIPEVAEWANEPMFSKLVASVAALKELIAAKVAAQAQTANA